MRERTSSASSNVTVDGGVEPVRWLGNKNVYRVVENSLREDAGGLNKMVTT